MITISNTSVLVSRAGRRVKALLDRHGWIREPKGDNQWRRGVA